MLLSDHLQIFLGSISYKLKTEVHIDGLFSVKKLMISFKWLTLVSTILFIMEGVSFPTLVPPLKWFLVWLLGKVRICSTKSVRGRKTKDQSNTADLADALIGSVLKSQGGESTTLSYFDSTAHQQCIYVFMTLWRKHWDDVINKWSHGTSFHYRDSSSGIKGFMTCGQVEDAEEQPFDRKHSFLYKYCHKVLTHSSME